MMIILSLLLIILIAFLLLVFILRTRVKNHENIDISSYNDSEDETDKKYASKYNKPDQLKQKEDILKSLEESEFQQREDIGFWTKKILSERFFLGQAKDTINYWQSYVLGQNKYTRSKENSKDPSTGGKGR